MSLCSLQVHKRKVCRRSEMHWANAPFLGSVPALSTESSVDKQTDVYLLWSSVNASRTLWHSLLAGDTLAVQIPWDNVSLAMHSEESSANTLAQVNSSALEYSPNSSNLPVRDPYPTVILMTIVYLFILVTGVSGNLLTCLVCSNEIVGRF